MIEILQTEPWLAVGVTVLLGLFAGSFLNVVIHRVPIMMQREWATQCAEFRGEPLPVHEPTRYNLVVPGSACPACGAPVRAWQNIPLLSWLLLRGRCANCSAPISMRYPVVEFVTALLSVVVVWHFGLGGQGLAALAFTWTLVAASGIDIDHQLLPDSMTLPLMWAGLLLSVTAGGSGLFVDPVSSVLGAAFGYLVLWSVYWAFRLVTGREGMGYGDFKLLAALGAWLGWQMLPQVILLSALVGALAGIAMMVLRGRGRGHAIPFGPYLAAAGWIALIWGQQINEAYLGAAGFAG